MFSLRRYDDIELVSGIEWSRESTGVGVVGTANIGDDTVEYHVDVVVHWTEVVRQTDEERNPGRCRSINTLKTTYL